MLLLAVVLAVPAVAMAADPAHTRTEVIYGRKFGTALTMDVFAPKAGGNGAGVVFAVSEGWYSDRAKVGANFAAYVGPYLRKGYTVFAVCHGGNPKYALPDYIADMHRAVRHIRHHAKGYHIDAGRLGMTGDSAGGHLALMQGCAGRPGDPAAADPVDRQPSGVRAVVAFFPPTDFLNWGGPGKKMLGDHPLVPLKGAFAFTRLDPDTNAFEPVADPAEREKVAREVSPVTHAHKAAAPALIVVGDADEYIPRQQSQVMVAKLKEAGATAELIIHPGGGHDAKLITAHVDRAVAWFDTHLAK